MTHAFAAQEAASRTAVQVDAVFVFIAAVSLFFFLLVEGMLIYFAIRYRRRRGGEGLAESTVHGNLLLETVWIVIPSAVVIATFIVERTMPGVTVHEDRKNGYLAAFEAFSMHVPVTPTGDAAYASVAPQTILTHELVDRIYPVTPAAGAETVATVQRHCVGTVRRVVSGSNRSQGVAAFLGFRPLDNQSASLGYDTRTWFDALAALGAYPFRP